MSIQSENLPADFYKTFLQKINKVTVSDILRTAEKHIKLDNARVFVTGKGSDVLKNLENVASFWGKIKSFLLQ